MLVQLRDRVGRIRVRRHFDKRKTARLPGLAVANDFHGFNRAGRREEFFELRFAGREWNVANVEFLSHGCEGYHAE